MCIAVTFHKRFMQRVLDGPFPRQEAIWVEESQEAFFALFLMIYLLSIYVRAKQLDTVAPDANNSGRLAPETT